MEQAGSIRIPARSRRQAMDWGLVLVSQGIESTIAFAEEERTWSLLVSAEEHVPALEAIRLYEWENRHWPWRQPVFPGGLIFDGGSLAWMLLVGAFYCLSSANPAMRAAGVMDAAAVTHGEWWRLFTAVWLHADLSHLASNAGLGLVFLGLAMGRFGTGVGLLAAYLAGAGGNVLVWGLSTKAGSLGASGMVMGSLGLLAAQSLAIERESPHGRKYLLTGILAGLMLFVLLGLDPASDIRAHLGGFVAGALLGGSLSPFHQPGSNGKLNALCGGIFALLVIWPWWLALRHA